MTLIEKVRQLNGMETEANCGDKLGFCRVYVTVTDKTCDIRLVDDTGHTHTPMEGVEESILETAIEIYETDDEVTLPDAVMQAVEEFFDDTETGRPTALKEGSQIFCVRLVDNGKPVMERITVVENCTHHFGDSVIKPSEDNATVVILDVLTGEQSMPKWVDRVGCDLFRRVLEQGHIEFCKHKDFYRNRADAKARYNSVIDGLVKECESWRI